MQSKQNQNYFILFIIINSLKQYKKNIIVKKTTKNLIFLKFLWINQFIYGYKNYNQDLSLFVFLRAADISVFFKVTKLYKKKTHKNLLKEHKWAKNSFFIVKTNKGLLNEKICLKNKIGGFLLYKCF